MLYQVTIGVTVEIDSPFITDVEDELQPLITALRIMIKDNVNIGLAPTYRAEMVSVDPRTSATTAVNGQWLEKLLA